MRVTAFIPSARVCIIAVIVVSAVLSVFAYRFYQIKSIRVNICENVGSLDNIPLTFGDGIPYILHQSWKSCQATVKIKSYVDTWKKTNPNAVYKFWTDDEIDTFVSTKYPEMYKYFTRLARPVMKSDIFRLLVVHAYGGTWADVDTVSFRNMQSWTKDHDGVKMIIGIESDYPDTWYIQKHARSLQFTQWTFAAAPKHPLITKMLDSILLDLKSMPVVDGKIDVKDDISVLDFAGPGMFTDVTWEYYKEHGYGWWRQFRNLDRKGVKVMDVLMLPQIRWGTNQIDGDPESWVLHKFEGSWKFTWFGWLVN